MLEPRQSLGYVHRVQAQLPCFVQTHGPGRDHVPVDRREAGSKVVELAHQFVVSEVTHVDEDPRDVGVAGHLVPRLLQAVEVDGHAVKHLKRGGKLISGVSHALVIGDARRCGTHR